MSDNTGGTRQLDWGKVMENVNVELPAPDYHELLDTIERLKAERDAALAEEAQANIAVIQALADNDKLTAELNYYRSCALGQVRTINRLDRERNEAREWARRMMRERDIVVSATLDDLYAIGKINFVLK